MRTPIMLILAGALALVPAACGGDDDGGGSASGFCDLARDYDEEFADSEPSDAEAKDALDRLADAAPDEISDDVQSVVDALDAIQEAGTDPERLAALEEELAGTEEASARVETFLDEECGIAPESE